MDAGAQIARRSLLASLITWPLAVARQSPQGPAADASSDVRLRKLELEFTAVAEQLDLAIMGKRNLPQSLLDDLDRLEKEMINTPATSMAGLRAKARAAQWALLDDIDPSRESSMDRRMALSIVRDLASRSD